MVELEIGCLLSQINAHWISQPYAEKMMFLFPILLSEYLDMPAFWML